jgi:hypothetical protein
MVCVLLAAMLALVPFAEPAGAHSLPAMTELDDVVNGSQAWSLREGVNHVADHPGSQTHVHLVAGQTYVLDKCDASGGSLKVTGTGRLMIDGGGSTIVQTCPGEPVFELLGSGAAEFYDVTITGGTDGGIVSSGSDEPVFVDRAAVVGNTSADGSAAAIEVDGPLKIWSSTIAGNTGGSGGAIESTETLNVLNATIVGNEGPQLASGVSTGHKLFGTVLAEPVGGANCAIGALPASSAGYNWSTDASCPLVAEHPKNDVSDAPSPQLRPLFRNGGPLSFYPEKTSPLLDRIPGSHLELPPYDQRSLARPQGTNADVGAIEVARCGSLFGDIAANHPFCWEIGWLAGSKVTTGYPGPIFKPDDQVTRQSMAAFMYRLAGSPRGTAPTCASAPFPDVGKNQTFCGEIDWLVDQAITTGYSDGTYKPLATVGRQAMAAFMYRLAGSPDGPDPGCTSAPFPDIPADHPFCGEITWLVGTGVTAGYSDGTFKPDNVVTRQSMAAFMYRLADGLIE